MNDNNIYKFVEKLNKVDGNTYTVEEVVEVKNGVYEGELDHDNVSNSSVRVYTESKLTGEKIDNFILTIPSKTPWKRSIKIFTNVTKVYITYETQGDTVEAEDINKLQESVVHIKENLDEEILRVKGVEKVLTDNLNVQIKRSKASEQVLTDQLNNEINRAKEAETALGTNLNVTNTNLNAEIDRAKSVEIGLDKKKADKTYADYELNKRYLKEEVFTKEEVLEKIKNIIGAAPQALDTLQELAKALNNDSDFVGTITKKLTDKVDKIQGKQLSTEDYSNSEKQKLLNIEDRANNYVHPKTHEANIIVENINKRFVSDSEKNSWNEACNKSHDHINKSTIDGITEELINKWNGVSNKAELNHSHSEFSKNSHIHDDRYYTEVEVNNKFVTKEQLGNAGYGDMVKSIYDKNDNGKVDVAEIAESIEWYSIKNKPNSLPASGGVADGINFIDNRSIDDKPKELNSKRITAYFKSVASVDNPPVGASTTYVYIINVVGWSSGEGSGGWPIQLAVGKEGLAYRQALNGETWGEWIKVSNIKDIPTKISSFENDKKYVTESELSNISKDNMSKEIYDTDRDGIVDFSKNADMLDGKHESDFLLRNDNRLSVKIYKNLASYNNNNANVTGSIIFHTKIPFTACAMLRFRFIGYTYDKNNGLEFVTSGYNYSNNSIVNYGTNYLSSYKPIIRWAKNSSGCLSIIVGDVGTVWQYPKLVIADVIESYNGNESFYNGWTSELSTNISNYQYITNIPENKTSKTWNELKGV